MQLHDSVRRQFWYLVPPLVCLAVADDEISSDEKLKIIKKLLNFEVPTNEELQANEPCPKNYLPRSKTKRSDFVQQPILLLFKALKFIKDNLSQWIESGSETFDFGSKSISALKYREFCKKVSFIQVKNDMSERHIKLVQDFIHRSHKEEHRQDVFQVVKKSRSSFPIKASKAVFSKKE